MASIFPNNIDSDLELPSISDNVSEIGGDVINALKSAIINIQNTIGISPQGNASTVKDRLNVSLDANGLIKKSALENLGLLALPVVNSHVGATAGIEESKLDLDYGTAYLKALISSLQTSVSGLLASLTSTADDFNKHIFGTDNFHDGYHIKINSALTAGVAGLEATTIGDAINELSSILISGTNAHMDGGIPINMKHRASVISVDASGFSFLDTASTTVQEVFDDLDTSSGVLGVTHVDTFHDNGILKEINSGTYYNSNRLLVGPITGISYTVGTNIVQINGLSGSFASNNVVSGDILNIPSQTGVLDSGNYQIRAVGPLIASETLGDIPTLAAEEIAVFHTFSETILSTANIIGSIYKPVASSSQDAPLACAVRNNEALADTISIINPQAARVVSVGFNSTIFNTDGYDIMLKVGVGSSLYRSLEIPDLHLDRLGTNQADPVSSISVAERINSFVSDPTLGYHFPITAARVGDEIVIAHNWVGSNYTLEVVNGYSANYAMGFDAYGADIVGQTIKGNLNATYSINGTSRTSLHTTFEGYSTISSSTGTLSLWANDGTPINPVNYGIGAGSVMHVYGHATTATNGSYTILSSNTTTVSLQNPEMIDAPTNPTVFNVMFLDTHVPLDILNSTETTMGLIQILLDSSGTTFTHQRLIYGTNLGASIEIIDVTSSFPVGSHTLTTTINGDNVEFNLISDSVSGVTAVINNSFIGNFKLYHSNNIDYVTIKAMAGIIVGGIEIITVNDSLASDEAFLLCTAHFNGTLTIDNVIDNRLFGNLSAQQVRDDFIELYSQRPTSDLHSNGVVRGFEVMDLLYVDSQTDMQALPLSGGVAYVDGVRLAVESQKVTIQSNDEEGVTIKNAHRIIGINSFGSIQAFSDELGELLTDGYEACSVFGKILPLYYVTIKHGEIYEVIDIRRFINSIDEKLDIIVDETNNFVGTFKTLDGALLYAENYPNSEKLTVKIIGTVSPQSDISVPNGVSIIGSSPRGGSGKHQIINTHLLKKDFISLAGNNYLENVEIISTTAGLLGALVAINGSNVNVSDCALKFEDTISSNVNDIGIRISAVSNVSIVNNIIDNVFSGIEEEGGCSNLLIDNNIITHLCGVGVANGVKIYSNNRAPDNITIKNNDITGDNTAGTDIIGVSVDVGFAIGTLRIEHNNISCDLNLGLTNYMSSGIKIINSAGSGTKVAQLIIDSNYINNVKMSDSSVYGIYLEDITSATISNNTLYNVAVYNSSYSNTGFIWLDDSISTANIFGNTLKTGGALRGIYIKSSSTIASLTNNIIEKVGSTSAVFIYGLSNRSQVCNNILVGPGDTGIWWKGERSKISSNHLSTPDPLTNYSFKTGIYAQASYLDIENNTITDMVNEDSIGITNASNANAGLKIIGNTIDGTKMANLINLDGNYHIVSGNRLKNDTKATTSTYFINLGEDADGVSIMGNFFEGKGTSGIYSAYTVTNVSVTNNTFITTLLTGAPIRLADTSVAYCLVMGNRLPAKSTYTLENAIGITPTFEVYNDNTIGVSRGLLDTRSIPSASGISAYETGDSTTIAHWSIKGANAYWEVNKAAYASPRYLYFPLDCIPNGGMLKSVQLQGYAGADADDTFTAQLFKRSVKTAATVTAISDVLIMSTASGEFTNSSSTGLIDETDSEEISEIINYEESNYFVRILYTKNSPADITAVRIYGATVSFRY